MCAGLKHYIKSNNIICETYSDVCGRASLSENTSLGVLVCLYEMCWLPSSHSDEDLWTTLDLSNSCHSRVCIPEMQVEEPPALPHHERVQVRLFYDLPSIDVELNSISCPIGQHPLLEPGLLFMYCLK